jgi:hypothetical protein
MARPPDHEPHGTHQTRKATASGWIGSALEYYDFYKGYNAIFPSFYPELFPTRARVTAMAIAQNTGTTITALLPALFATVAPPGSTNIPMTIGAITFGITAISAVAAWTARETYRTHLNDLGDPNAVPVAKPEYDTIRAQSVTGAELSAS